MAETKAPNTSAEQLITEHLDIWTTAIEQKSSSGRGSSKKFSLHGIKKLRELILELAVRGKLVSQDPNDEPASYFYERIQQYLLSKLNKSVMPILKRDASVIEPSEFHYRIPTSWIWCELQDITIFLNGKAHEKFVTDEPVFELINSKFVSNNGLIKKYVTERLTPLNSFDIALVMSDVPNGRALARCYLVEEDNKFTLNQRVCGLSSSSEMNMRYLKLALDRNKYLLNYNDGKKQTNLKKVQVVSCPIALPPINEQHRIVAKVDELMDLCDALEAQTENSIAAHQTLVEVLLEALLKAPEQGSTPEQATKQFQQNWQRLSEHFDTLFTTTASIDTLKQTILQLAVMGKLVPQNPNDEPAAKLLERIAAEKAQLIKDKKIKKQKPLPEITNEEKPFELPNGWEWVTLSHIGLFTGGKTPSKANSQYWNGDIPWVTPKDMKVEKIFDSEDHVTRLAITDGLAEIDPESLLFVARSGILRRKFPVAITKSVCTVNQDLKVLSLIDKSIVDYILLMMKGFEAYILKNLTKMGTTVESLRFDDFSKHYFIIPPLEEQYRIVAKVDELMALCDQLKARLTDAQTTKLHLTDAIVEQAL